MPRLYMPVQIFSMAEFAARYPGADHSVNLWNDVELLHVLFAGIEGHWLTTYIPIVKNLAGELR